jgi:hypothetical protein
MAGTAARLRRAAICHLDAERPSGLTRNRAANENADEIREQCGESDRRVSSHIRAMIWMPAGNSVLVRPIGAGRMQAGNGRKHRP